jgi:Secretion system C-terminal sorting domain
VNNQKRFLFHLLLLAFILLPVISGAQGIEIESGGSVTISGAASIEIEDGGFVNNGTYTKDTDILIFSGSTSDSINGEYLDVHKIIISNTGGIKFKVDSLSVVDLNIESGSALSIKPAGFLTVSNTLSNNAGNTGLVLHSDISGYASLLNNTTGVPATVEHYITGDRWHILSSSTPGQSIPDFLSNNDSIPHNGLSRAMTFYDETQGKWAGYFNNTTTGSMDAGEGFLIRTSCDTILYFAGNLQNTDVSNYSLSFTTRGWHSIGNPFPSAIKIFDENSVNNFLNENENNLDANNVAIYIWDEQPNYYGTKRNDYVPLNLLSESKIIQPGQGFLVKVSDNSSVSFSTAIKAHYNDVTYAKKSARANENPHINIKVGNTNNESVTSIYFVPNGTVGLDSGYDAGLFGGIPEFNLYSHLVVDNGIPFMIQALPFEPEMEFSIPLGLDCAENSLTTFNIEKYSVPDNFYFLLEDKALNKFIDLSLINSTYTVNIPSGLSGIGRFYLHAGNESSSEKWSNISSDLRIYSSQKELIVEGGVSPKTKLQIIDLLGRTRKIESLQDGYRNSINVSELKQGIYLVLIEEDMNVTSQKVFIE